MMTDDALLPFVSSDVSWLSLGKSPKTCSYPKSLNSLARPEGFEPPTP